MASPDPQSLQVRREQRWGKEGLACRLRAQETEAAGGQDERQAFVVEVDGDLGSKLFGQQTVLIWQPHHGVGKQGVIPADKCRLLQKWWEKLSGPSPLRLRGMGG